jgi:hypothetical protein
MPAAVTATFEEPLERPAADAEKLAPAVVSLK